MVANFTIYNYLLRIINISYLKADNCVEICIRLAQLTGAAEYTDCI